MAKQRIQQLMDILRGAKAGARDGPGDGVATLTGLEQFAHFCRHAGQSFVRNRCLVRASALAYSSLLALIPMLAVVISVTSGLLKSEGEDQIYGLINQMVEVLVPPATVTNTVPGLALTATNGRALPTTNTISGGATNVVTGTNIVAAGAGGNADMVQAQKEAARSIHEFVQKTQSSALGLVGMLLLVYVAISMLANIEATFNDIWGITKGRKWRWRIVLYWTTLTLGPLVLAGALSLTGSAHLEVVRQYVSETPLVGNLIFKLLPLVLVWVTFALIYLVVPNTRVRWSAALVGAVVAGTLWQLNNWFGYLYVSRVVTNSMIYGSLGLVPVLMLGLYFSWVILLFGAQVACAFQNRLSYIQDQLAENVNQRGREFIALRLMTCLGLRYQQGQPPATVAEVAVELGISPCLTQQIIATLLVPRLITEVAGPEAAYCPARPLEAINAHQILLAVRSVNQPEVFARPEPVRDEIYGEFARIEEAERVAAAAITLRALVERAKARREAPAVTLALPEPAVVVTAMPRPATVPVSEVTMELAEPGEAPAAKAEVAPEKPARRIVVPEDNHDFPL